MIHANGSGFALLVVGGLLGGMSSYFLKLADPQAVLVIGAVWAAGDGILRATRRARPGWLFDSQTGGSVWHVPVWIVGFAVVVIDAVLILAS